MKKVAVILAGCGHKDGAEITETVSLIIELSKLGLELSFFAPDQDFPVRDPISNHPTGEQRNVLMESARITRGQIQPLEKLIVSQFAGLALPGGSGVARNLCAWAEKGAAGEVLPAIQTLIREFHQAQKPIAAICISPVLLAKVLGPTGARVTIGDDSETIAEIAKTGAHHQVCQVLEVCIDKANLLVTTPAYMYDEAKPHQVFAGISKLAQEFVQLIERT